MRGRGRPVKPQPRGEPNILSCPECGVELIEPNVFRDRFNGEVVCKGCGLVLNDFLQWGDPAP